jgi:7-cyano-7-deazaguanine synthase
MSSTSKALVLLSGGQDSSTVLFWALKNFEKVFAMGFRYGQKHELELEVASEIAKIAEVPYYVADISTLPDVSKNALTSDTIDVEKGVNKTTTPNTLVEGRNLLFITYAAIYCKANNIQNIILGVGQTDYSGYPDCRNEFIESAQQTISLATDYNFKIHTPLMWKDKAATWALAGELGVLDIIKTKTLTCYNGIIADGCSECPACILRKRGLEEYLSSKK